MFKDLRKNENKGFSLVELIVVIAIMAVMTAVLAPALLQYVEKSRAQKDDSAMGEVVEVVKLALAEQDVYDECLCYTVEHNNDGYAIGADETEWQPTGDVRGLTITFHATKNTNATKFALASGVVNEFVTEGTKSFNGNDATGATLGSMSSGAAAGQLNSRVQAGIPNGSVDLTSQTYRNSDYTIFIKMGAADEAVVVTGGWNGTNLPANGSNNGQQINTPLKFGQKYVLLNDDGTTYPDYYVIFYEDGSYTEYEDGQLDTIADGWTYTDKEIIAKNDSGVIMSISQDGKTLTHSDGGCFVLES